jgi:DNA-directed RNA polymerase subunit RPC12/RpoP
MALLKCAECKNEVSDTAKSCPKCGAKVVKPTSRMTIGLVGIVSVMMVMCTYNSASNSPGPAAITKTPEQIAAGNRKEAEFQDVVRGATLLKTAMKNPDSFKLESAVKMSGGAVCYEYRSRNSFNAVVPGFYVSLLGAGSTKPGDWNKYCANKTGTDYSYARRAL